MTITYQSLKADFILDPSIAIEKSQQLICAVTNFPTFKDFYNYHLKNAHISTCQNEWTKPQMSIHCVNCSKHAQSCLCLQCFINGNHQGHEYYIRNNSTGNCDCGDTTLWKRSGFCQKHQGLGENSHPEDYIDEQLRTTLTDTIFKAAFSSLISLLRDDGDKLSIIFQFITSFLSLGDGFRRLVVISLTEKIDFESIFLNIVEATREFNEEFRQLCGYLINDQLFRDNFTIVNFRTVINCLIPHSAKMMIGESTNENIEIWDSFWFHSYSYNLFKNCIEHFNWDWVEFAKAILNFAKDYLQYIGDAHFTNFLPDFLIYALDLEDASKIQPNEQTQKLLDEIFTQIVNCGTTKGRLNSTNDTIVATSFSDSFRSNYFSSVFYFNSYFFDMIKCFKSKPNLKLEKVFIELDRIIDVAQIFLIGHNVVGLSNKNENDQFVSNLINHKNLTENFEVVEKYYKSFRKGAKFFITHPMFYSFAHLLRLDNLCRVKIARFLSMAKYQSLRVRLGIITLKNILAFFCAQQSIVQTNNEGALNILSIYFRGPGLTHMGTSLFLPLFQLLVGLQCNEKNELISEFSLKEFFAFEMAREIGIFDASRREDNDEEEDEDDDEEIQRKMTFVFLYFSLLLVIERTLFNFDGYNFMKEQIVFALKQGFSRLNELSDKFDKFVSVNGNGMFDLNQIVNEVASARQAPKSAKKDDNDQDVTFDLKDDVEIKNISAINSINSEKVIMNNEISKHPENLLKIQSFEPEETFFFNQKEQEEIDSSGLKIRLKEFLMTPTVLAVIYHTLRTNRNIELNDHLSMNILILISKFSQEIKDDPRKTINEETVIDYDSTVVDLVSQFKRQIFNFKVDKNKNATIENKLTKQSFNSFLKVKISSKSQDPKSFIDILLEKGELGKKVLTQMSIEIPGEKNQAQEQDLKKMQKIRARKMKEDIMNHFKSVTSNFNTNEDQNDELIQPTSTEKDVCSICSTTRKNEVLSFPLYIYRTKFPFIIDRPPLVQMTALESMKELDVSQDYVEDDEEEEFDDQVPDPDDIFAHFLASHPEYDITPDLDEEDVNFRQMMLSVIQQTITERCDQEKQNIEERKREREMKKSMRIQRKKEESEMKQKQIEHPDEIVEKRCTAGNTFVIQFGICQHPVHPHCVNKEDFTCPIDRTFKNGFLPNINDLTKDSIYVNKEDDDENLTDELKEALNLFIERYSVFFNMPDEIVVDTFVELVKSISGIISTYEIRLRSLPGCLDSKKTILLSRNLFLTTWYAYRMKGKPRMTTGFASSVSEDVEKKLTLFQRFIKKLVECDEIEESCEKKKECLTKIISSMIEKASTSSKREEKELFVFLRRVCLADHFLLLKEGEKTSEESKLIDWDEVLCTSSISSKFNVSFKSLKTADDEFELKPFSFGNYPKEFLRFAAPPFNFPIEQTRSFYVFNMLDYNYLIQHYDDLGESDEKAADEASNQRNLMKFESEKYKSFLHLNFSTKNYPTVLMYVGIMCSKILVVDGKRIVSLRPFYLDKYGCTDIGFERSQPLMLNEDRYEKVVDEILSGDFSTDLLQF